MGPKRKKTVHTVCSPAQKTAKAVTRKYRGKRMSPDKKLRVRRALYSEHESGTISTEVTDTPSENTMTLRKSVIKGYHAFQIRPPFTTPPTRLPVEPEYTNIHDIRACLVWLPPLDSFPDHMHSLMTDEKRQLRLADVAGLPIGHVPRSLAGYFRSVMEDGNIFAEVTGEPIPSFSPWPEQNEEGGGIVLPCSYIITHPDIQTQYSDLSELLSSLPEGSAMELVL